MYGLRGMGDTGPLPAAGTINMDYQKYGFSTFQEWANYCGNAPWYTYALHDSCWKFTPEAWREMAQFPTPPAPTPSLAPPDLRMVPADESSASATTDALIAQNKAAQNQQYLNFFASVEQVGPKCEGATLNADGTWSCPSTNWWLWAGLAGVGLFLLMGMRR